MTRRQIAWILVLIVDAGFVVSALVLLLAPRSK